MNLATTLGELKSSGYQSKSIKDELRDNLIAKLQKGENAFPSIIGFDNTVLPDIERAILSRHNILLLGLRGQAKTRIARLLVHLLDEYMPIVAGSEMNDDPLAPLSYYAKNIIAEKGDQTPIEWVHRDERYIEKLATPDVSIADLIGDVDPIKAASLKLPYSDQRVIHFGLIARAHRSLFVINELPDLQARIQVALFNILQEGDIQIRGFKLRLPLDIQFMFTANPEDYTNRGSIITPLKDRIESQILTHYPKSIAIAQQITAQEARIMPQQADNIAVPDLLKSMLEQLSFLARDSEYIDEKSGVSARLSIAGLENLYSTAERRMLINNETQTQSRIIDLFGIIPAITGKVELVYEGEQLGAYGVAMSLISRLLKMTFLEHFPNPEAHQQDGSDPYGAIKLWFNDKHQVDLFNDSSDTAYQDALEQIAGLKRLVKKYKSDLTATELPLYMELALFGLAEFNILNKDVLDSNISFKDLLANMLDDDDFFGE